jgi:hypothetical protein
MSRLIFACLTAFAVLVASFAGAAAQADDPVDLSGVSGADLRVLQAALILTEDYNGTLDGRWGPQSRAALAAYGLRVHGDGTPRASHLSTLVAGFEKERRDAGWTVQYFSDARLSLAQPLGILHPETSIDGHLTLRSRPAGLIIRRMHRPRPETESMHDWAQRNHRGPSRPTQVLGFDQMISSFELEGRTKLYLRSDLVGDGFASVLVQGEPPQRARFALVTASLRRGPQPDLVIAPDGALARLLGRAAQPSRPEPPKIRPLTRPEPTADISDAEPGAPTEDAEAGEETAAAAPEDIGVEPDGTDAAETETVEDTGVAPDATDGAGGETAEDTTAAPEDIGTGPDETDLAESETPDTPAPEDGAPPDAELAEGGDAVSEGEEDYGPLTSSGTGFFVSPTAIVTAAHVVRGCVRVTLEGGTPLTLVAEDELRDLAVLEADEASAHWLGLQADSRPRLGQTVAAVGFPFYGLAGEEIVLTTGNISSILDAESAADRIMISAPVQPGNSGGPLLSAEGEVVGMVAARADDAFFLEMTGTMPQAMNFAVRLGALRTFLEDAGIALPSDGVGAMPIANGLGDAAQAAIRPVLCELPDEF